MYGEIATSRDVSNLTFSCQPAVHFRIYILRLVFFQKLCFLMFSCSLLAQRLRNKARRFRQNRLRRQPATANRTDAVHLLAPSASKSSFSTSKTSHFGPPVRLQYLATMNFRFHRFNMVIFNLLLPSESYLEHSRIWGSRILLQDFSFSAHCSGLTQSGPAQLLGEQSLASSSMELERSIEGTFSCKAGALKCGLSSTNPKRH